MEKCKRCKKMRSNREYFFRKDCLELSLDLRSVMSTVHFEVK